MKDRAIRRHHHYKAKRKLTRQYTSCIDGLSGDVREDVQGNVEKLKKVCTSPYSEDHDRKLGKKTLQERKADISMREQVQ